MEHVIRRSGKTICCMPLELWPEKDKAAWHAAIQKGSLFEEQGLGAHWAPVTVAGVRRGYGRWLMWLGDAAAAGAQTMPADRVTRDAIARYVTFMRTTTADSSASTYLSFLHMAVRAMAPDGDWAWMKKIYMRLKRNAAPVRLTRDRIQSSRLLLGLGIELMDQAALTHEPLTVPQALAFRDGLIIALLAGRPLRTKNFLDLVLGETLVDRGGAFWISFGRKATKSGVAIEEPFPLVLVSYLQHYVEEVRPFLIARYDDRRKCGALRPAGNHLWVSKEGSRLSRNGFFELVCKRTAAHFDRPINPQLFRSCLATTIATEAPDHVGHIRRFLGHATSLTSERYYNHADGYRAAKLIQDHVRALRRKRTIR